MRKDRMGSFMYKSIFEIRLVHSPDAIIRMFNATDARTGSRIFSFCTNLLMNIKPIRSPDGISRMFPHVTF